MTSDVEECERDYRWALDKHACGQLPLSSVVACQLALEHARERAAQKGVAA